MITIYSQNETNFADNGLGVLEPISCDLSVSINGAWVVEMEHPYDEDLKYTNIQKNNIIKITDIPIILEQSSAYQLFRIYDTVQTLSTIKVIAFPVAFEATYDAIIEELKIEKKTATLALQDIMSYLNQHGVSKYTVTSDYSMIDPGDRKEKKGDWANTNLIAAISGSDDGSIINHWGGEVAYDNYKIIVNGKLGTNKGYEVRYGKNLTGLSVDTDLSGVVTRLYPISSDNVRLKHTVEQEEVSYYDSGNKALYPYIRAAFVDTPYQLIDTSYEANKPNTATAILTHTAQTQLTNEIKSIATQMWNALMAGEPWETKFYEPEWVQSVIDDVIATLQKELTNDIEHPSWKNLVQTCIKDGIDWIKKEGIPDFYWEETSSGSGVWTYTNGSRVIKNQYIYVDKKYCKFNSAGNYEPPADEKEFTWIQKKGSKARKKFGNNRHYHAHDEDVYITMNGTLVRYYMDEEGWYDNNENVAEWSKHNWGTSSAWFGEEGATSSDTGKFAHDTWLFIDGTYYYFNSEGYVSDSKSDYRWDWVQDKEKYWFGNKLNHEYAAVYISDQWMKIDGEWFKFNSEGYLSSIDTLKKQLTTILKNALLVILSLDPEDSTILLNYQNQLYALLYDQMIEYCKERYEKDGIDLPAISVQVNMIDLMQTPEYADITEEEPTPEGYWDCDDEWKTTDFTLAWVAPYLHDRYWKWNYGLACGCIGNFLSGGQLVTGIVCISYDMYDSATSSNGKGGTRGTSEEIEIEGQTFWRAGEIPTIIDYQLQVSAGYLPTLDFYSAHGRHASSFDEFLEYFLEVSHFTTKKISLKGIHLGDDVQVVDYEHGFNVSERVVSLKYDCLRGYNTEITIDQLSKSVGQMIGNASVGSSNGENRIIPGEGVTITNGVINVDVPTGNIYEGSQVSVEQMVTGGQEVAKIYVDGIPTSIFGDGNTNYTAGANIQISPQNVISATDTTYNDFAGSTHGLVPEVGSGDSGYLKSDGSWDEPEGTAVEANPTGTATDTLSTILIDDTIYDIQGGGGGGEIVTSIIENGNNFAFLYTEHDIVAYSYPYVSFSAYSSFVEGTDHGIAIYKLAIPKEVKKIRYSVYLMADYATSQSDNYKFCVGVKSTLDTTNYTNPTDNDFIAKNLHSFTREGDTITGELAVESSADFYIYIIANGWHCTLSSLQLVRYSGGGASSLEELEDVDITNPSNGQMLTYDSQNDKWVNTTPSGGSGARELTQSQYDALSQAEKTNGTIYFVKADTNYEYHTNQDGTLVVRIDTALNKTLWFFRGYTKTASDIAPPSELAQYAPSGLILAASFPDGGTIQNGWVGFYNNNIRSWTQDTAQLMAGTFWAVLDVDGGQNQTTPYYDPYDVSTKIYFMGTEYASKN